MKFLSLFFIEFSEFQNSLNGGFHTANKQYELLSI